MKEMNFLGDFKKNLEKAGLEEGSSKPPKYWFSTGNYVLNKILSGSFLHGFPQGRISCLTGPSGTGKSFLAANAMREAQKTGAHIVVLDSENALDDDFVTALGVDVENNYTYVPVDTIPQVQKVMSAFITGYKEEYEGSDSAPHVLLVVDSLDMLMTETESENFDKGVSKGDMGQRNRQLKALLRQLVQAIKHDNLSILVTAQVYKNQDMTNGEGVWIVADAIKYSCSHIALLTKLKLRSEDKSSVAGIRMKVEGYKTRFTKPFQTITLEVPYETGMDPFSGLLEVAVEMGVIEQKGSWYYVVGTEDKFQSKNFADYQQDVLIKCESSREKFLEAVLTEDVEEDKEVGPSAKAKRAAKAGVEK